MRTLAKFVGAALALGCGLPAAAQEWPNRPVKIIVPYAAGGSTDSIVRVYAERLSTRLGQSFVIENRGGAGGAIGLEAGAKSAPDGYTLIQAPTATLTVTPQARKVQYDPFKSFAFIGRVTDSVYAMGVHPSVPANDLRAFIAYAKKNPGKINFGSAGVATSTQFAGEMLNSSAGIEMIHVPYRGSADALTDLLAGTIQVQFEGILFPHYKAGKIKILGVTTPERYAPFPEIPTIREVVPAFDFSAWSALLAPAGTPDAIIRKLSAEVNRAADEKEVQEKLLAIGFVARHDTPEALAAELKAAMPRYAKLIKDLKLDQ